MHPAVLRKMDLEAGQAVVRTIPVAALVPAKMLVDQAVHIVGRHAVVSPRGFFPRTQDGPVLLVLPRSSLAPRPELTPPTAPASSPGAAISRARAPEPRSAAAGAPLPRRQARVPAKNDAVADILARSSNLHDQTCLGRNPKTFSRGAAASVKERSRETVRTPLSDPKPLRRPPPRTRLTPCAALSRCSSRMNPFTRLQANPTPGSARWRFSKPRRRGGDHALASGTYVIECIGNVGVLADMIAKRVREVGGDDAVRRVEEAFRLGSAEGTSSRPPAARRGSAAATGGVQAEARAEQDQSCHRRRQAPRAHQG